MTHQGHTISRSSSTRKWMGVLALLAFFFQSLVVQTHIHQPQSPAAAASQHVPAPLKTQDPIDQCRLCQELVHAGTFLAPSAAVSLLSLTFVAVSIARVLTFAADPATAFAWQSRAPPRR